MDQRKYRFLNRLKRCLLACMAALVLAGCGGGSSSSGGVASSVSDQNSSTTGENSPVTAQNQRPRISGIAPATINVGNTYQFQPSASDADGDALSFQISNLPSWATFDPASGTVTGTPTIADVGTTSNIVISVSDGVTTTTLAAFSIAVTQISTGSATISWLPPTENTDGSALTDLAGYRIYYGTSASALTQTVTITNPGLTSYVVQNLAPATWYFTVRAFAADATESGPSNIASKTIQ